MKGDFSRNTFRKQDHYSRVLQQQGRVQLDADWNELNDIWLHRSRTTRYDVIGPACGPENDAGFEITAAGEGLFISPGRYYVHGMLVELDSEDGAPVSYTEQIDYPSATLPTAPGRYRAVLDVWERHLTALEQPYIREVALGGPDTATRTRVIAQVKLIAAEPDEACEAFSAGPHSPGGDARGLLSARSNIEDKDPNPCVVPPSAGYRRLENQLYRVEIHDQGKVGSATYKWSRENGSIVSRIVSRDGDNLVIDPPGRDENLGYHGTNWIEITDGQKELAGEAGVMVQLASAVGNVLTVDPTTLDGAATLAAAVDSLDPASRKVRRWESAATPITTGSFITLEEGVQVQFKAPGKGYRTGDYWIIPARTNTGDVEWPEDELNLPLPVPPRGIDHFLAPLALLTLTPQGNWTDIDDCRCLFPPLSDLPDQGCCCCTATVGDGSYSTGDFTDIQQAINVLLEQTGGKQPVEICLLPGVYRLKKSLRVENMQLTIRGCGEQSRIIGPSGSPALRAKQSSITLKTMAVKGTAPAGAIVFSECVESGVMECMIENSPSLRIQDDRRPIDRNRRPIDGDRRPITPVTGNMAAVDIDAYGQELIKRRLERYIAIDSEIPPLPDSQYPAVVIRQARAIEVCGSELAGFPSLILQAREATICRNRMREGGTWVQDGSMFITMEDNLVLQGDGPGILLGGVMNKKQLTKKSAGVSMITIARNHILLMGDSGIASGTELDDLAGLGDLEDIRIIANRIEGCGRNPLDAMDGEGVGGIVLKNGAQLMIQDNIICRNGSRRQPASGILIEDSETVSIHDNTVQDNGSEAAVTRTCVDFRERDDDGGEVALVEQAMRFENFKAENGVLWRIESNVMHINRGSGMRCQAGMRITLSKPADLLDLLLIGGEARIRVLDAAGNELESMVNTPPVNVQTPRAVPFRQGGMTVVEIAPAERLWLQQVCTGGAVGYQAGIAALFVHGEDFRPPEDNSPFYTQEPGRSALVVQGNTVVTPAGQALWVVGTGQMLINDNELISRNVYAQPVPEADAEEGLDAFWLNIAQAGRCASVINLGIALEFSDLLVNADFAAQTETLFTADLNPVSGTSREIPPGLVQFNDNQVLFYTGTGERSIVLPSCLVLSFDDVSFQDNQVRSDVGNGLQVVDAMVLAATTRVSNNRFSETFTGAFASLVSFAMMNTTVGNIATHCIFAFARPGNLLAAANQVAITQNCPQNAAGVAAHVPKMQAIDLTNGK